MKTVGVIPARLASSRLPRKLLLADSGKPLLQYTWEAASRAAVLSNVIVATDSEQIAKVVQDFGGRAELTGEHASGTDRVAEIAKRCCADADVVVNIQGDEPEIDPKHIDVLVQTLWNAGDADMATLGTSIRDPKILGDPSCTKLVCDARGHALYFSRAAIPHYRDGDVSGKLLERSSPWTLHLGIYAYRRDSLLRFAQSPPSPLEEVEKLEQLRALEAGMSIVVTIVDHYAAGIDTPEDYAQFLVRQRRGN